MVALLSDALVERVERNCYREAKLVYVDPLLHPPI